MEKSNRLKFVKAMIEKMIRKALNPTNSTISSRKNVCAAIIPKRPKMCTFSKVDLNNAAM
jgi:hypothetical protein